MSNLTLTADEVRAVLDSMKTNDHCELAYHMEITQVREKIEAFAGDGGLVLRRGDGETPPLDLRERAREWIAGFHAATEEDAVNTVALLLAAADDAYRCGAEGHRSGTRPTDAALAVKVREVRDIQGQPGNWDYSPYMHGMFNGLELALSILEGDRKPDYRDEPEGGYRCDRASANTTTALTEAGPEAIT